MHNASIPLLDLKAQFLGIRDEIHAAITRVLNEQRFILGPEVESLEAELADYLGVPYCLGVSSGSDAILMSLLALGVGAGDDVITTPYSFIATAEAILRVGARPRFVDIDPQTFNLDPKQLRDAITPRTKAILPVHLFGRAADLDAISAVAPHLPVIEDAAQAIGARYKHKSAGALGSVGCFSFFPSKNLGAYGDGGLVCTSNEELYHTLRALRIHGQQEVQQYHHTCVGGNFRLDAIQAAILRVKLRHIETWTDARRSHAAYYRERFSCAGLDLQLPPEEATGSGCRDVYNQFVIRVQNRDALSHHLKSHGIACAIYYPSGLHHQPCFSHLGYATGAFPHTEKAAQTSLALPVYPEMTAPMLDTVVETISDFLNQH